MLLFLGVYILTPSNKSTSLSQVFIISLIKLVLLFLGVYILTPSNKSTSLSQVFIISLIKLVLLFLGVYKLVSLFIGVYNSRESSPYITPRNKSTSLEHEISVIQFQTYALIPRCIYNYTSKKAPP